METYPIVQDLIQKKKLKIYCWWFDIATADVYSYNEDEKRFKILDDEEAARLLSTL